MGINVLRLCSVFEPPETAVTGRGARFDPLGGMQSHTAGLSRALDRRGVVQTIVTTRPPTAPRNERFGEHGHLVRLGLPVQTCKQFYSWAASAVVPRLARDADLVHVHLGEDLAVVPLARHAARQHRLPLVLTVHTSLRHTLEITDPRSALLKSLGGWLERKGTRDASAVIVLTDRAAQRLRYDGVPADRVHVVPGGVAASPYPGPDGRAADPLAGIPHPRVAFLGRLRAHKDVEILIRAAALAMEAHVVLVGDGPHRPALERLTARLGLTGRVHFTGFVPHSAVPAVLHHADVLAVPSRYQEFGTAAVEGMQAGLPVIAASTGGIPNVIEHGVTGLLVPPGDPEALAKAIRQVLTDQRLSARLAGQARQRAASYDWERVGDRVLSIYQTLLAAAATATLRG